MNSRLNLNAKIHSTPIIPRHHVIADQTNRQSIGYPINPPFPPPVNLDPPHSPRPLCNVRSLLLRMSFTFWAHAAYGDFSCARISCFIITACSRLPRFVEPRRTRHLKLTFNTEFFASTNASSSCVSQRKVPHFIALSVTQKVLDRSRLTAKTRLRIDVAFIF